MLTLDLLRHGALEGGPKYRGQIDEALTLKGRSDMDRVWAKLSEQVDGIITSPLSRCAEPARAWACENNSECLIEPRIAEMFYGQWEGKTKEEIESEFPGQITRWRKNPEGLRPPGGESTAEFEQRIKLWWQETCNNYKDRHMLVVAHSGTIRMIIAHALHAPVKSTRHLELPYACWSRVTHHEGHSSLVFHQR